MAKLEEKYVRYFKQLPDIGFKTNISNSNNEYVVLPITKYTGARLRIIRENTSNDIKGLKLFGGKLEYFRDSVIHRVQHLNFDESSTAISVYKNSLDIIRNKKDYLISEETYRVIENDPNLVFMDKHLQSIIENSLKGKK